MRMDIRTYLHASPGRQRALAAHLELSAAQVNQWASGKRPVPAIWCAMIEAWSGGQVSRAELRPHDHDMLWPDL